MTGWEIERPFYYYIQKDELILEYGIGILDGLDRCRNNLHSQCISYRLGTGYYNFLLRVNI